MWSVLSEKIKNGEIKALAKCISLVEHEAEGYDSFLETISNKSNAPIIGITGPPGAGKSTLTDALVNEMVKAGKRVAVLCVDPSSPFNKGALLGDRIRMNTWHDHPQVYIRSMASQGSLGGLHPKILEVTEILKMAEYDYIIIETVGVGQNEIEIAGIADVTLVVLVPESGDEIQTMKSGIMEIADIFVVNKSDRPGADAFLKNLRNMLASGFRHKKNEPPVIATIAHKQQGVEELLKTIESVNTLDNDSIKEKMLTERLYNLIREKRMKDINREDLVLMIRNAGNKNLYALAKRFI